MMKFLSAATLLLSVLCCQGGVSEWQGFAAPGGSFQPAQYRVLKPLKQGEKLVFRPDKAAVPYAEITGKGDGEFEIVAKAEKDAACSNQAGNILLLWKADVPGNWTIRVKGRNLGNDVKGGDGGWLGLNYLPSGSALDTSYIGGFELPSSNLSDRTVEFNDTVKLNRNDAIVFRVMPGADGFADCFVINAKFEKSSISGRKLAPPTAETLLPQMPEKKPAVAAAAIRPDLFWLGTDGSWADSVYAEESLTLFRKFVPGLAVVMICSNPNGLRNSGFYARNNIPTVMQTWGSGYESYFRLKNAFEWDFWGRCHDRENAAALSGSAHAAAMPHPAFRKAFECFVSSVIGSGYSGAGFCDMVWFWGAGRGVAGYNPATVAAFRKALTGDDDGLQIQAGTAAERSVKFRDYADYYLGGMPSPQQVGCTSWQTYHPLKMKELEKRREQGLDNTAPVLLFDLLVHYEWLKTAQFIGTAAQKDGGFFQCMPNPEDLSNGADFRFLAAVKPIYARSEEYFNSPLFINGAYYRFPYLRSWTPAKHETGVVVESGAGGNALPYYSSQLAFNVAYELTLATQSDHMEGDFWPSNQIALKDAVKNPELLKRYQSLLMYGLGFSFARQDDLRRPEPDFISYTSRRIFRPWGWEWHCWNYWLDNEMSPDAILADNGFLFDGRGEDNLAELSVPAKMVFYSPSVPTGKSWQGLLDKLEKGTVGEAVVMAESLQQIIDKRFQLRKFDALYPSFNFTPGQKLSAGTVKDTKGVTVATRDSANEGFSCDSRLFQAELTINGEPLVVKRKIGKGTLHVLLFSPVKNAIGKRTADAACAAQVWTWLLSQAGITPHWQANQPLGVRIYRRDQLTLASVIRPDQMKGGKNGWTTNGYGSVDFSLQMIPGTKYSWLVFPTLERGTAQADDHGKVNLSMRNSNYQFFYLVPETESKQLDQIAARLDTIKRALTLDGLVNY